MLIGVSGFGSSLATSFGSSFGRAINKSFVGGLGEINSCNSYNNIFLTTRGMTEDEEDDECEESEITDDVDKDEEEIQIFEDIDTIPDLSWRVEKMRLEEANTRRFLKAKPRFLPYEECRKWVVAWDRWDSEDEWVSWIQEGEKRNSYIPAKPDEYYGRLGQWKGWDHFLGKEDVSNDNDKDNADFQ